jgi:hypothetical protein
MQCLDYGVHYKEPLERTDPRHAPPYQAEDERQHDGQMEDPIAHAQVAIVGEFGKNGGLDEGGQAGFDFGITGCGCMGAPLVVRVRMDARPFFMR